MVDKIQDEVAFQVFDAVFPESFQHLEIDIGKVEGFYFPVVDQPGVAGFPVVVVGKPFTDAVGFFFAHADIDQPGFFERVLNLSTGKEDEVQSHNAAKRFYIPRFKSFRLIEKDFNCFHGSILTRIVLHFKTFLPVVSFQIGTLIGENVQSGYMRKIGRDGEDSTDIGFSIPGPLRNTFKLGQLTAELQGGLDIVRSNIGIVFYNFFV
jgi:hypothetical protein